jgi:cbb3-type cytochrome oxidase subunit 3
MDELILRLANIFGAIVFSGVSALFWYFAFNPVAR